MFNQTAVGIVLVTAALAAAAPAAATTGAATTSESAVTYLASGKTRDDAAALRHVARYYPLELEFARPAPGGRQPADVDVMIKDRSGRMMLRAKVEGDLMLAQLPAGEYAVSAICNGVALQKSVNVEQGRHHKLDFAWKS